MITTSLQEVLMRKQCELSRSSRTKLAPSTYNSKITTGRSFIASPHPAARQCTTMHASTPAKVAQTHLIHTTSAIYSRYLIQHRSVGYLLQTSIHSLSDVSSLRA